MAQGSIWLCGDVHGNLHALRHALAHSLAKPRAVLFVGDLDPPQPVGPWLENAVGKGIETAFIHGNHETDDDQTAQFMFDSPGSEMNLDGRVVEIGGLRVAGLGGVFCERVWYPPSAPKFDTYAAYRKACIEQWGFSAGRTRTTAEPLEDERVKTRLRIQRSTIFPDVYNLLADQQADILIVHEAPSCHPHGFEAIDLLAQCMRVRWVVHGHHHDALDYNAWRDRLGFTAIGVGLRGISTLEGTTVVAGELDAARATRRQATSAPAPRPTET